jgi:hypothetical protein
MYWPYELNFALWLAAVALTAYRTSRRRTTAGLSIAFLAQLGLVHLYVHFIYWAGDYAGPESDESIIGFRVTGLGVAGYILGTLLFDSVRPAPPRVAGVSATATIPPTQVAEIKRTALGYLLLWGCFFLLGLTGFYQSLPGLEAVFGHTSTLFMVGVFLQYWINLRTRDLAKGWLWLALLIPFPFIQVTLTGMIGYGIVSCITTICLVLSLHRVRWWHLILVGGTMYVGLSFWVTYVRERDEFRQKVWRDRISYDERVNMLFDRVAGKWQWFDPGDDRQCQLLNRMDQNTLVGHCYIYMTSGGVEYARGETLLSAVYALVPRALWADKPVYAGSGRIVSKYTGLEFAGQTSVGVGHVMELFLNFGTIGVVVGFVAITLLLHWFDARAGDALAVRDYRRFARMIITVQPLLVMQGNFAEISAAMVAGYLLARFVEYVLDLFGSPVRVSVGRYK